MRARNIFAEAQSDRLKAIGNVSSRYIDYMTSVLTDAMGPMASVILHEQITAMGELANAFPKVRVAELIDQATREILSDAAKANCKRAMLEGIGRIDDVS